MKDQYRIVSRTADIFREDLDVVIALGRFPLIARHLDRDNDPPGLALFHSAIEIQFVCEGKCSYFVKDSVWSCERSSVLLIHSNEMHNHLPTSCDRIRRYSLIIGNEMLERYRSVGDVMSDLGGVRQIEIPEKEAILSRILLEEIIEETQERRAFWQDAVSACVLRYLIILARHKGCHTRPQSEDDQLAKKIVQYLDENATRKLSLDELAEQFSTSKYWISRKFHRDTGATISNYIMRRRVSLAKTLLESTDMKVASVAIDVGFDDLSAFNRSFKIVTGITPSQYRRIFQSKGDHSPNAADY